MAWFDTYTDAPNPIISRTKIAKWEFAGWGARPQWTSVIYWRQVTERRGMTYAAATAYADTIADSTDDQTVNVVQASASGGYNVIVTQDTAY